MNNSDDEIYDFDDEDEILEDSYGNETHDEEDSEDIDLDELQDLLEEGLEPRAPKRKMNPNSLANLRRGGIDDHIKKDKMSKREEEIRRRVEKMNEDPIEYYKNALVQNLIKEEMNLEELQTDLSSESVKSNQQRLRNMIYSTTQSLLLLGDALKAQPKQNKVEDKNSLSALAQMFEEFRKTLPPDQANNANNFREEIERMREEYQKNLENGEFK